MRRAFAVKRAAELMDEKFMEKWRDRQSIGALPRLVLRAIHDRLLTSGGPVEVDTIVADLFLHEAADVRSALADLDAKDMVAIGDGRILVAYPFAGAPTAFRLVFPDGRVRYAACAIDALGVPPMLGHPVSVHSECHHCGEPFVLEVRPDGPRGAETLMVWVGDRGELRQKAFASL